MKNLLYIFALCLSIVLLTGCASSNKNLDEFDKMDLQDESMINGQTFQHKQFMGDFCKNPSY